MTRTITIDPARNVFVDGEPTGHALTMRQAQLLRLVMGHTDVATRDMLLSAMYGGRDEPEIKIIDSFAFHARRKLGAHHAAIQTAWGRGYYRNREYELAPENDASLAVNVSAKDIADLAHFTGQAPDKIVNRLVAAELQRLWSEAA